MKHLLLFLRPRTFVSFFSPFLFLFFNWYTLALLGLFSPSLVLFCFIIALSVLLALIFFRRGKIPSSLIFTLAFSFLVGFIALQTHPPELLAGRDQGSLAEAALRLTDQESIIFEEPTAQAFFAVYGPGTALHFPGFTYTDTGLLTPQFPLGYIVWLAGFLIIFGTPGIAMGNLALFLLSVLLLVFLLRFYGDKLSTFLGSLLFTVSFLPLWFLSFTLSENLALVFFLLTLTSLLHYLKTPALSTMMLTLSSALAFGLTRIEGWGVLLLSLIFFFIHSRITRSQISGARNLWVMTLVLFSILITGVTFLMNISYFKIITKALIKIFEKDILGGTSITESPLFLSVLWQFGLLPYFIVGTIAALYFLFSKKYTLLLPLFLCLPTLPYLILPSITFDTPWMLRRFLFTLYPTFLLLTWWGLSQTTLHLSVMKRSCLQIGAFFIFFVLSLPALTFLANTRYSENLLPQVTHLASRFSHDDLLLVDKEVTGNGFMIPTLPLNTLLDKNAVYFFNPEDLAKLDRSNFANTYLLIPETKEGFYRQAFGDTLIPEGTFTFYNDHIFVTKSGDPFLRPNPVTTTISIFRIP